MNKLNSHLANRSLFEACEIGLFITFLALKSISITAVLSHLSWSHIFALFLLGQLTSDFISGVAHWVLDTWGTVDTAILGQNIAAFREHHVYPMKMVSKSLLYTNGDNCGLAFLILLASYLPYNSHILTWFLYSFSVGVAITNQAHRWSHMSYRKLPLVVKLLQKCGLILSFHHHHNHHIAHKSHYCITNGWMNAPLEAIGFWRKSETCITWLTGEIPRVDDHEWIEKLKK